VSKLSGWLNAAARCRAQREASVGRGATCGAGKLESAWGRRGRREQCAGGTQLWRIAGRARAERTSNMLPMFVTLDVSKLSGWLNAAAPCRVQREASEEGRHAGRKAARALGGGGASSVLGGPNYGGCWQGTRGAHRKHLLHGCDAGRVEAQRLVERRRFLPGRKASIGRGATCRPGGGRAWGSGGASSVLGGPNCGV